MPGRYLSIAVLKAAERQVGRALTLRRIQLRALEPGGHVEHRGDRVRIVDVVGADERRVDSAGLLAREKLIQEIVGLGQVREQLRRSPVLIADDAREIRPGWIVRIGGRVEGMRTDMAVPARHGYAERANQVRIDLNGRVVVIGIAGSHDSLLPIAACLVRLRRRAEEIRIRYEAQPDHTARIAIDRDVDAVLRQPLHHLAVEGFVTSFEQPRRMRRRWLGPPGEPAGRRVDVRLWLLHHDAVAVLLIQVQAEELVQLVFPAFLGPHARLVDHPAAGLETCVPLA